MDYTGGSSNGGFKQPKTGLQVARIYKIIDIGTQEDEFDGEKKKARKVVMFFELAQKMDDGRPYSIFKEYNQNISAKNATLRKHLESWSGKKMTPESIKAFDIKVLLGKACMVNLVLNANDKAKVDNVMAVPEGTVKPAPYNEQSFMDLDAVPFDHVLYHALPDWVKDKIALSPEYLRLTEGPKEEPAPTPEVPATPANNDDIPF